VTRTADHWWLWSEEDAAHERAAHERAADESKQ